MFWMIKFQNDNQRASCSKKGFNFWKTMLDLRGPGPSPSRARQLHWPLENISFKKIVTANAMAWYIYEHIHKFYLLYCFSFSVHHVTAGLDTTLSKKQFRFDSHELALISPFFNFTIAGMAKYVLFYFLNQDLL